MTNIIALQTMRAIFESAENIVRKGRKRGSQLFSSFLTMFSKVFLLRAGKRQGSIVMDKLNGSEILLFADCFGKYVFSHI